MLDFSFPKLIFFIIFLTLWLVQHSTIFRLWFSAIYDFCSLVLILVIILGPFVVMTFGASFVCDMSYIHGDIIKTIPKPYVKDSSIENLPNWAGVFVLFGDLNVILLLCCMKLLWVCYFFLFRAVLNFFVSVQYF